MLVVGDVVSVPVEVKSGFQDRREYIPVGSRAHIPVRERPGSRSSTAAQNQRPRAVVPARKSGTLRRTRYLEAHVLEGWRYGLETCATNVEKSWPA